MGSLRFLLALSVACGHFGVPLGFPTSDVAVQSFFVISGFYMALVLNEKYGPGTYWLFLSNRLLRIWPAYFLILILSLAATGNWRPAVIVSVPRLFEITGKLAWDKYIGELSYPFYICHFLFGWLVLPSTYLAVHSALLLT